MKITSNTKILRKLLILCLLTTGLAFVASKDATPVSAKTCDDAISDLDNAFNTFDTAFQSYYYNSPTSCTDVCVGSQDPDCYNHCRIDRRTALGNADTGILQADSDLNSCTSPEPNYCANARAKNTDCLNRYNYRQYSDLEQRLEVFNTYLACRDESGIDTCQ